MKQCFRNGLFACVLLFSGQALFAQNTEIFRLDSIHISGNNRTRNWVILNQLPVQQGVLVSGEDLAGVPDMVKSNLTNLNLFNQVYCLVRVLPKEGEIIPWQLYIMVVEKWYLWPLPFLEFADRNVNQWSEFDFNPDRTNYGLYLFQYNLGGGNHTLKLSFIHGYTQMFGIEYESPRIGSRRRWGISAASKTLSNREVWVSTTDNRLIFYRSPSNQAYQRLLIEGGITYHITPNRNFEILPVFQRHELNDTLILEKNPFFLGNGVTLTDLYGFAFVYREEFRDNRFFPTKGHYAECGTSLHILNPADNQRQTVASIAGRLGIWRHVGGKISQYHIFRGSYRLSNRPLPYFESRALGYKDYIRGYEHRVIDGNAHVYFRHGLRYRIWDKPLTITKLPLRNYRKVESTILGGIFLDHGAVDDGNILNRSGVYGNELSGNYLFGYGISVEASFYYDKVFRFEMSRNADRDLGLSLYFRQAI